MAKDSYCMKYTFLVTTFLVIICDPLHVQSARCDDQRKCKFGGTCQRGQCVCKWNCINKGWMPFCGYDDRTYINHCYIMMQSCEVQREVPIKCGGTCRSCSLNKGIKFCENSTGFCLNGGVCIESEVGRSCLCPRHQTGNRCEIRLLLRRPKRRKVVQGGSATSTSRSMFTAIICICCFMFSLIVANHVRNRINLAKRKSSVRRQQHLNSRIESSITQQNDTNICMHCEKEAKITNAI